MTPGDSFRTVNPSVPSRPRTVIPLSGSQTYISPFVPRTQVPRSDHHSIWTPDSDVPVRTQDHKTTTGGRISVPHQTSDPAVLDRTKTPPVLWTQSYSFGPNTRRPRTDLGPRYHHRTSDYEHPPPDRNPKWPHSNHDAKRHFNSRVKWEGEGISSSELLPHFTLYIFTGRIWEIKRKRINIQGDYTIL